MNYYFDTEFHEYKKRTWLFGPEVTVIDLISIGISSECAEDYYAICKEFDVKAAFKNAWLRDNVLKKLWQEMYAMEGIFVKTHFPYLVDFTLQGLEYLLENHGKTKSEIAKEIEEWIFYRPVCDYSSYKSVGAFPRHSINFYAYYAAYDWVLFCQLHGGMMKMPTVYPQYCKDLKQVLDECIPDRHQRTWKATNCPEPSDEHHALADARWNRNLHMVLKQNYPV